MTSSTSCVEAFQDTNCTASGIYFYLTKVVQSKAQHNASRTCTASFRCWLP